MLPLYSLSGNVFTANECWFCQKFLLHLFRWSYDFYSSVFFLMWSITLIVLQILKNPHMSGINPIWPWYVMLLVYCWIQIDSILLRNLHLCSSVILTCNFLSCGILVWFCYQSDGGLIDWVWGFYFHWNFLEEFQKDRC